jgi:hypothetical protein
LVYRGERRSERRYRWMTIAERLLRVLDMRRGDKEMIVRVVRES